ncbi:hypothetical protein [Streptomyces sp. NPDC006140]|uniref:hypothetical protein n=1 Tax=Streptomyces sp. NPDC006140 TaxID=3154579 RepID=UPI0033CC0C83
MVRTLDRTTVRGKRDAAVLLIAWWMAARASEPARLNLHDAKIRTVQIEDEDGSKRTCQALVIKIRSSKADQAARGREVLILAPPTRNCAPSTPCANGSTSSPTTASSPPARCCAASTATAPSAPRPPDARPRTTAAAAASPPTPSTTSSRPPPAPPPAASPATASPRLDPAGLAAGNPPETVALHPRHSLRSTACPPVVVVDEVGRHRLGPGASWRTGWATGDAGGPAPRNREARGSHHHQRVEHA